MTPGEDRGGFGLPADVLFVPVQDLDGSPGKPVGFLNEDDLPAPLLTADQAAILNAGGSL